MWPYVFWPFLANFYEILHFTSGGETIYIVYRLCIRDQWYEYDYHYYPYFSILILIFGPVLASKWAWLPCRRQRVWGSKPRLNLAILNSRFHRINLLWSTCLSRACFHKFLIALSDLSVCQMG